MITVKNVYDALFSAVPESYKMPWDNVGLLCGHFEREVHKIMLALDPMPDVFEEAKTCGCDLIVTHHPLIFGEIKAVNDADFTGRNLLYLIENGIAAINLHTNLDCAPEGVNQILAEKFGLSDVSVIEPMGTDGQGRQFGLLRMGTVEPCSASAFAKTVKTALSCGGIRYADCGKPVHKVAVGGGSCGSELSQVIAAGCDTFVTADLKYNHFEEAKYRGVNLIDAGHFATENPCVSYLARILRENFPQLPLLISKNHHDETLFL